MIEKTIDILKFLFTTTAGWIMMGAFCFLSLAITGSLNPYYLIKFFYLKIFVWK